MTRRGYDDDDDNNGDDDNDGDDGDDGEDGDDDEDEVFCDEKRPSPKEITIPFADPVVLEVAWLA